MSKNVWIRKGMVVLGAALVPMLGCDPEPEPVKDPPARTQLRVPLYSYIPDAAGDGFQALAARIERDFELQHPEVDLVVNPSCFKDDLYEPDQLASSLKGEGECAYDVVETDTALLGELVGTGAVRPWSALPEGPNWHPAGVAASKLEGKLYGVPHWLCTHYIVSRSQSVANARTVDELLQILSSRKTPEVDLAANLLGSWNLPSLYLDAWSDTHGPAEVQSAVSTEHYDTQVIAGLKKLAGACETSAGNPCIDGTFDADENFDLPATLFAEGKADVTLGYSERLHTILKKLPSEADRQALRISPAPLGEGNQPLLFTDSFFLGAHCVGDCEKAATAFVTYMSQASTYAWILLSEDAPAAGRVPRYLMPATLDAYQAPGLKEDPLYQQIDTATRTGGSFPNKGLLGVRKTMRDHILQEITAKSP
ncbi:hypothetical protein [Vitiosangium sp. GDMCC 1.1324]|uniref:hypothetical protein n=1 Tax=Vitiosangium sp. (strain GDMCC 1.1324) TaxID=2138576 RepID=UPI000D39D719|nr:hypothetical protein [Vitiosangium sp. GDMCC 1.1324]PTL83881.1 hypothetical protein DAT35_10490 [Vitiosangium sp. GDMCC 1.1324]